MIFIACDYCSGPAHWLNANGMCLKLAKIIAHIQSPVHLACIQQYSIYNNIGDHGIDPIVNRSLMAGVSNNLEVITLAIQYNIE